MIVFLLCAILSGPVSATQEVVTHHWTVDRTTFTLRSRFVVREDGSGGGYSVELASEHFGRVTYENQLDDIAFAPVKQSLVDLGEKGSYIVFEFRKSNYLDIEVIGVGIRSQSFTASDTLTRVFAASSRYGGIPWTFKDKPVIAVLNRDPAPNNGASRYEYVIYTLNKSGLWFDKKTSWVFGNDRDKALEWTLDSYLKGAGRGAPSNR
jgi:hypothetical protein